MSAATGRKSKAQITAIGAEGRGRDILQGHPRSTARRRGTDP